MQAKSLQKGYVSLVEQACAGVPGFRDSYQQFHQNNQYSTSHNEVRQPLVCLNLTKMQQNTR